MVMGRRCLWVVEVMVDVVVKAITHHFHTNVSWEGVTKTIVLILMIISYWTVLGVVQ